MPADLHAPGSDAALDAGCECPVSGNRHGWGWIVKGQYVYNTECPYHFPKEASDDR